MNYDALIKKMNTLEYHQSLLLKMISNTDKQFYKLIIEKTLSEKDVEQFNQLCDKLSLEIEEQKAEGFVYFHPLFEKFKNSLHPNLHPNEVIQACLRQQLYLPLMLEFRKYIP